MIISIEAQNKYFKALNIMIKTGVKPSDLDSLYDDMIAEFQTAKIGLNENQQNQHFTNLCMRFVKFSDYRIARKQLYKFQEDKLILKPYPDLFRLVEQEKINEINAAYSGKYVDPLDFIDSSIMGLFKEAENKATLDTQAFTSDIRCAAFCEILYVIGYMLPSKYKQKRLIEFAKGRYDRNIKNALSKNDLERYRDHGIKGLPALLNCFSITAKNKYISKAKKG